MTQTEILISRFFSRVDTVAVASPWGRGRGKNAPCPVPIESAGHLAALIDGHVMGTGAPEVEVRYSTQHGDGRASGRFRVGSYTPAPDGTTRWLCLDFDGAGHSDALADPLGAARLAATKAASLGLTAHLERSGSATGWHLWVLFDPPVEAAAARKLGHLIAPVVPLEDGQDADSRSGRGIEVFPKQDTIRSATGLGNLVWLPWWSGAADGGSVFTDLDGREIEVESLATVTPAQVAGAIAALMPKQTPSKEKTKPNEWRVRALERLPLEQVYGSLLTGKSQAPGWLECRDPWSTTGDRNPSAGVADGSGEAERGSFHSFRSGETISVFDFMIRRDGVDFKGAAEEVARLSGVKQSGRPAKPKPERKALGMPGAADDNWRALIAVNDSGVPKVTNANLILIFRNDERWKDVLGFNERRQMVEFCRKPPLAVTAEAGTDFTEDHAAEATIWLQTEYEMIIKGSSIVYSCMVTAAKLHRFDPVREWLDALPEWDGVARVDEWLIAATGCENSVYTRAIASSFMIGACARVYQPGAKVDTVLVLQGPQGALKSTLLRALAVRDEWFTDHLSDIGGKDAAMQLCGPWILEIAEMDGITGKRENERVKSWTSQQRDRFRPPYGRSVVDVPRRCVFAATSNLDQFLRDETGGRRFLPVVIKEIDLDVVESSRDQLWAEARSRYLAGEKWWLTGDALVAAKEQQEDRRVADPWEDAIRAWLKDTDVKMDGRHTHSQTGRRIYTTANEVLVDCLKIELGRQSKSEQDRVGRVLRVLKWRRIEKKVEGCTKKCWLPPLEGEATVSEMKREAPTELSEQCQVDFGYDVKGDW